MTSTQAAKLSLPEPRRVGPWEALTRRPIRWLVLVVVLAAAGLAIGSIPKQSYSAQSELVVGSLAVPARAVPSYTTAATEAAATYADLVGTRQFNTLLARTLGPGNSVNNGDFSASAPPGSAIVTITATADHQHDATQLASAAATTLAKYSSQLILQAAPGDVLTQFRTASETVSADSAKLAALKGRLAAAKKNSSQAKSLQQQVISQQALVDTDRLQLDGLSTLYQQAQQTDASAAAVQVLSSGDPQGSNRGRHLLYGAVGGAVAGALIGLAWVMALANRDERRRLAAAPAERSVPPTPATPAPPAVVPSPPPAAVPPTPATPTAAPPAPAAPPAAVPPTTPVAPPAEAPPRFDRSDDGYPSSPSQPSNPVPGNEGFGRDGS
jgi:hypothetical protein